MEGRRNGQGKKQVTEPEEAAKVPTIMVCLVQSVNLLPHQGAGSELQPQIDIDYNARVKLSQEGE